MEQRFKSLSLFDFRDKFPDTESCMSHLAELKWGNGYKCPKCGHDRSCNGMSPHSRQCSRCRYTESPTAGTLFHKVKFDLLKAFYIVYFVSTELATKKWTFS
ncbi:MAG: transposase [Maribacter sp.]|nr:transposase [Maribacter sp.]